MSPASLGIICFRRRGDGGDERGRRGALNAALVAAFEAHRAGAGVVDAAARPLRDPALRHEPHEPAEDVTGAARLVRRGEPAQMPDRRAARRRRASRDVDDGWLGAPPWSTPAELAACRCSTRLDATRPRARRQLGARAAGRAAGEVGAARWDAARDFYVVLEGAAAVGVRRRSWSRARRPGDFFGELAALDWGAGYGYARSATVCATAPLRLLVLRPRTSSSSCSSTRRSPIRSMPRFAPSSPPRERVRRGRPPTWGRAWACSPRSTAPTAIRRPGPKIQSPGWRGRTSPVPGWSSSRPVSRATSR